MSPPAQTKSKRLNISSLWPQVLYKPDLVMESFFICCIKHSVFPLIIIKQEAHGVCGCVIWRYQCLAGGCPYSVAKLFLQFLFGSLLDFICCWSSLDQSNRVTKCVISPKTDLIWSPAYSLLAVSIQGHRFSFWRHFSGKIKAVCSIRKTFQSAMYFEGMERTDMITFSPPLQTLVVSSLAL